MIASALFKQVGSPGDSQMISAIYGSLTNYGFKYGRMAR